jgi:hypothetical protein
VELIRATTAPQSVASLPRFIIFFNSHSGGWCPSRVHSARRPLNGLLYLRQVIMMMENLVEWKLAGETEVFGENLPQCHFVHHKSHLTRPGSNPGRRGRKPATNRLSYGAAPRFISASSTLMLSPDIPIIFVCICFWGVIFENICFQDNLHRENILKMRQQKIQAFQCQNP